MRPVQRLDLATTPATPWKNGGGATRALVCWPPGAALEDFGWRVSVATLAAPGAFSPFPGVDRHIMLLQGRGVHLQSSDGSVDHWLARPWEPFAFAGEAPVQCRLSAGAAEDFNLMLRRGQWRGSLRVLRAACVPGSTAAGLCMVLAGRWERAGECFAPGQGLWWSAAQPGAPLCPAPGADAALAWVGVAPLF